MWKNLNTPFKIGDLMIPGKLSLGPMAGVTDKTFRTICKRKGCDLLYSEMVSAKGIYYNNKNTEDLLATTPEEHIIGLQLFGSEPELMGDMAGKLKDRPFDFIDVNMGCPVPKVVNNGEGSFLMTNPALVEEIVSNLVKKAGKPVTVKIRKGFTEDTAVEIAKAAESGGASAVAVHGRLRTEYYSGYADWDCIRRVKENVGIPVIGSGDVVDEDTCLKMLTETGVDGIMIARAAQGNPWIFEQCKHYLETGEKLSKPSVSEVKEQVLMHAKMLIDEKPEEFALRELRKHVAWYFQGYKNSAKLRAKANMIESYSDLEEMLEKYELSYER